MEIARGEVVALIGKSKSGKGSSRSKPVVCKGYVEMTGYAEKMGILF